ncbi:NADP-dependent alcohol dehydrogenase C [Protomyces lactucae-debilis]|uniref:NADP-dependent alcohol dehydrogenase C n=1 Tax=Protomyces lactucae-debilis TaxID=2754530 RepID=A0A1Y2FAV0_PROLT|nr:NADP-dependent alcohol dehydrogenase C [Protomyces lactucae-debilis]ORY81039.1 NADP-dependent alcohol dehydrogenase C [Protomyces lactucae-debilis]
MSATNDKQKFRGFYVTDAKNWSTFKEQEAPELKPFGEYDIDIKSECCGVCSSDVHTISSGWGAAPLPVCAGHEVVGRVERVGSKVTEFKVGDRAGVGAQVWSCGVCTACTSARGDENYCPHKVDTYGAPYPTESEAADFGVKNGKALGLDGSKAQGGYSNRIRAHEQFVFPIPAGLDSAEAAPLMCAGLTVFSPLVRAGAGKENCKKVAIAGVGGLGHYAVQFAKAMGAEVTVFTHSASKKDDIEKMGADKVVVTANEGWEKEHAMKFDFMLSTIDAAKGVLLQQFCSCLRIGGEFHSVGLPDDPLDDIKAQLFAANACKLTGSHIGSKKEMLQMLKLVEEKKIKSWIMKLPISAEACKEAVERVYNNDNVRYRLVLTDFEKAFGKE